MCVLTCRNCHVLFCAQTYSALLQSMPHMPDECTAALRKRIAWGVATSAYQVRPSLNHNLQLSLPCANHGQFAVQKCYKDTRHDAAL